MKFNFVLSVDAQAGDQLDDMRDQIEAHGHEFKVTRGVFAEPPWFNIFTEGVSEASVERVEQLGRAGYQLVILVTEKPTLATSEGLVWNYFTHGGWTGRAEAFVAMAPYLTAAWCYAPGAAKVIRRFVPRAADIDVAWGKRFLSISRPRHPQHDFGFFGGLTPRRERVLNAIASRGHSIDVIPHHTPLVARDARIADSKIILEPKQYHWWDLASPVRYAAALCHGRAVVAEWRPRQAQGRWSRVVRFAPPDAFYETAAAALGRWQDLYRCQVRVLEVLPSLLPRALAVLPAPRTAPLRLVPAVSGPLPRPHDGGPTPQLLASVKGHNIVGWLGDVYAVPQRIGSVHLDKINLLHYPMIRRFSTYAAAERELLCSR